MNICLILFSDGWGGAEDVVHELARHLHSKGNSVTVVVNQEMLRFFKDLEGVGVFSVGPMHNARSMMAASLGLGRGLGDVSPDHFPLENYVKPSLRRLRHSEVSRKVKAILRREAIEVVNFHLDDTYSLFLSSVDPLGIPGVITLHSPFIGIFASSDRNIWSNGREARLTKVLAQIDGITYQCPRDLQSMATISTMCQAEPELIPNGVDLDLIKAFPAKAVEDDHFKLVYVGGSRWQKGGDLAVKMLSVLLRGGADVMLYMLGRIPDDHPIKKLTKELSLEEKTVFTGFIPFPGAYAYLSSADIVIIPSISEGFPVIAVEAMAFGKPIVATNVGGIPTALQDGRNAILVEPDENELARAVLRLMGDEGEMVRMSANNLEDVKRYDWSAIVDHYLEYFQKVAGRRNAGRTGCTQEVGGIVPGRTGLHEIVDLK